MAEAPKSKQPEDGCAPCQPAGTPLGDQPIVSEVTTARARIAVARLQYLLETDIKRLHQELKETLDIAATPEQRLRAQDTIGRLAHFRNETSTITWDLVPAIQAMQRMNQR